METLEDTHFGYVNMNPKPKPSSPTLSTFAPSKILPYHGPLFDLARPNPDDYAKADSGHGSGPEAQTEAAQQDDSTRRRAAKRFSTDDLSAYDLAPPPPSVSHDNAEYLAGRLFSVDHLNLILEDPVYFQRFRGFLNRHRPSSVPTLVKYLESQKALTAVRYANALVEQLAAPQKRHRSRSSPQRNDIATVDGKFEEFAHDLLDELVTDALPAYITYRMVSTVTEFLVREITGGSMPVIRDLVHGLAEVYCMSDPKQEDCPIIFASDGMLAGSLGEAQALIILRRVLQHHTIWAGICDREELSLPPRSGNFESCCEAHQGCYSEQPRNQRDHSQLSKRRHSFPEPRHDGASDGPPWRNMLLHRSSNRHQCTPRRWKGS
jgi:hypothetical protein